MSTIVIVLLFIISAFVTKHISDALVLQIPYKVKFKFAEKGYLLRDDPHFSKKEIFKIGILSFTSKLLRMVPLVNIMLAEILTKETLKTYLSAKYSEADKFYLSDEDKIQFFEAQDFLEKSVVVDKVTIDMGLAYFASHFKTSVIVNGILSLNCQLCPLSYTLDEIKLIANQLNAPVTFGKIDGLSIALIGARIFRDIKTFDNQIYEISNDFSTGAHFKVYLIAKEDLTDKDIDDLVEIVRKNRKESRIEDFYRTNSNRFDNYLLEESKCSLVNDMKLEKRL